MSQIPLAERHSILFKSESDFQAKLSLEHHERVIVEVSAVRAMNRAPTTLLKSVVQLKHQYVEVDAIVGSQLAWRDMLLVILSPIQMLVIMVVLGLQGRGADLDHSSDMGARGGLSQIPRMTSLLSPLHH